MITYCAVGAGIKKVRYGAVGTELIPNRDFWMSLPLFVWVNDRSTIPAIFAGHKKVLTIKHNLPSDSQTPVGSIIIFILANHQDITWGFTFSLTFV